MTAGQRGYFITLEGGEGAGKTTQAKRLQALFEEKGRTVLLTREPGGTPEAEKIRDLIVQRDGGDWSPLAECLLLYAARVQHVRDKIQPALNHGEIVICDRFADSTIAYQGYGHGFDLEKINTLHQLSLGAFKPDLTLVFDIAPKTGLSRAAIRHGTEDRMEKMDISFHERLRNGFLTIAKQEPGRCAVADAAASADDITNGLRDILTQRGIL